MFARRLLVAVAAAALVLLALVPAAALADEPDVSGTVTMPDGSPAVGFAVSLYVPDSDVAWSATTDDQGAWSATTGIQAGQTLSVRVLKVTYSSPDENGCVISSGLAASADVTIDALPVPPVNLVVAPGPEGKVCSATATPRSAPTPPATDAPSAPSHQGGGGLVLLTAGMLAAALVAIGPLRRSRRR